jgi:membrane-associated protease RseP (regulator of RpoE activity)
MKTWKLILPVAVLLLLAGQVLAQSDKEESEEMEARKAEYSVRLRMAEERMEQAAREIAEMASQRLPDIAMIERRFEFSNKPRIGITIDGSEKSGAVEGVEIGGITPESPADDAGLRAEDVITAVNDEPMTAESSAAANKLLLDFMHGVEEGDVLTVEYLRNGNVGSVELLPRVIEMHAFSWAPDVDLDFTERLPSAPEFVREFRFEGGFPFMGGVWGSMELVQLNEGLGRYFGTDSGLLVVSAPKSDSLELQDGDVIQTIDGREPTDIRHAMRILNSYESGESLKLGIMRDKKKRTLDVEVPADHHGSLFAPLPARPVRAPVAPVVPKPAPDSAST